VLAASSSAQTRDTQPATLQQLKEKLQQLEQNVEGLRQQIEAAEGAQGAQQPPASEAIPINAGNEAPPSNAGAEKSFDIYGYAMLDSGYDFKTNDPNWFDVVRPTKLPEVNGEFAPNGKVWFGVRQTRFGVKSTIPTAFGDLKTRFEFELFGTGVDAGQTTFRLRHAYGELGPLLAGQTWSLFMDPDVFPNIIEYWGPNGMVFFRNIQLRWMPINKDSHLWFALEQPGASADQGAYQDRIELTSIKPKFNMPDITGQGRITRKWGYFQAAGIVRKISWVDTNPTPKFKLSDTVWGWGVNLSSNLKVTEKDTAKMQVVYGDAVENYMNDAPVDIGIQNNFVNPLRPIKGVTLPVLGVVAFLDHNWSDRYSTSAGYSLVNIQNSDGQLGSAFHQGDYAIGNLLYHPIPAVTIGGEFQFGRRVNFNDGFNVNDYRVQFSFKYDWNKNFVF
jgi:outer membrane DcaP-like protein